MFKEKKFIRECPSCGEPDKVVRPCKTCFKYVCVQCSIMDQCIDCYLDIPSTQRKLFKQYFTDKYEEQVIP